MYGILLYDGVEPIDVGATFGVLSMARRIVPDLAFTGVARKAGPVACAGGLTVTAEHGFDDAPQFTDLIVTGGPGWVDAASDSATLAYLASSSARLSAICTGAMILEASGRLEGRRVTTKHEVYEGEVSPLQMLSSRMATEHAAIVDDGGIVSSGGVTLGIDAMFYCLARSHGEDIAADVARVMEYGRARAANREALGYR